MDNYYYFKCVNCMHLWSGKICVYVFSNGHDLDRNDGVSELFF